MATTSSLENEIVFSGHYFNFGVPEKRIHLDYNRPERTQGPLHARAVAKAQARTVAPPPTTGARSDQILEPGEVETTGSNLPPTSRGGKHPTRFLFEEELQLQEDSIRPIVAADSAPWIGGVDEEKTPNATSESDLEEKTELQKEKLERDNLFGNKPAVFFSHHEVGRFGQYQIAEAEEFDSRLSKWNEQVYYDPTILTGLEGGGSVAHN